MHGEIVQTSLNGEGNGSSQRGGFSYLFQGAPDVRELDIELGALDTLGDAMIEKPADAVASNSICLPPILTYVAQFLGHDLMLPGTPDQTCARTDAPSVTPIDRSDLAAQLVNLHSGRLELNSLYREVWTDFSMEAPTAPLLDPQDPAQMLVPRWSYGRLEQPAAASKVNGDPRDCSNLITQQFRLALILLHNRIARSCDVEAVRADGREHVFEWARTELRHLYQWLVVNDLLRRLCGTALVDEILDTGAPLYQGFLAAQDGDAHPSIPVEFYAAAFRFGHSMVRSSYDYNAALGRPRKGAPNLLKSAPLGFLLRERNHLAGSLGVGDRDIHETFQVDWPRLTGSPSARYPDRSASKIDSRITAAMAGSAAGRLGNDADTIHLARRNLRRGYQLNLASGQAAVAETNRRLGTRIEPLSAQELRSGPTGEAMRAGALTDHTPLWFYILKEAEIRGEGERLGPLGARLMAESVAGLVLTDPASYWHRDTSDAQRWTPSSSARLLGATVTGFSDLLRIAESS